MFRTTLVPLAVTATFALGAIPGVVQGQGHGQAPAVSVQAAPVPAQKQVLAPSELSPMHQEIVAMREALVLEVARMAEQLKATRDASGQQELQLRIDKAKSDMRVGSLEIQLRYARQEGREELVSKLEVAIQQFQNPVVAPPVPANRPRPVPTHQR
jgi:hypothetical protein